MATQEADREVQKKNEQQEKLAYIKKILLEKKNDKFSVT